MNKKIDTKLLYIHGLGGTKNGSTSKNLKKICDEYNIEFYSFDVPFMPFDAINKIYKFIIDNNINLLVASSLGAFYALYTSLNEKLNNINTIVINPAFHASFDILKNFNKGEKEYRGIREDGIQKYNLDDNYYNDLKNIDDKLHDIISKSSNIYSNWAGYFSNNDEYFSYKNEFMKYSINVYDIIDSHHIGYDNLKLIIEDYLNNKYFN